MVIKINGASRVQRAAGLLEMPSGIDFKSNKSHKGFEKKNLSNTINWKDVHFAKNNLVTKINEAN